MSVKTYSKKANGTTAVSTNFKVSEFACKDGSDTVLIDVDAVKLYLQCARNLTQKAIGITSGYRTATYNKKVGGATNSYHIKGQAFDTTSTYGAQVLARIYELLGAKGIGYYPNSKFTHVDSRTSKYYWQTTSGNSKSTFLTTTITKSVQNYLNNVATETGKSDYNCGTADGVVGAKTATAFKYFCNNATAARKTQMLKYIQGTAVLTTSSTASSTKKTYSGTFPTLPSRGYYQSGDGITTNTSYKTQIKYVQQLVNWINGGSITADGKFGANTAAAVKTAQKVLGLTQDGKFGSGTLAAAKKYAK